MTRITTRTLATAAATLAASTLMAATAQAGDMNTSSDYQPQSRTTTMVKTIDADGQVGQMTVVANTPRKTAVLGALAVQNTDAYVVEAPDGELFINHLIPVSDLPDPTLDPDVVDTYTYEYRGMTFTNRVVRDETFAAAQIGS